MTLSNEQLYGVVLSEIEKDRDLAKTMAGLCLVDSKRTLSLMDIIARCVREGDVGVDLGAGSAILGFTFLNSGGGML